MVVGSGDEIRAGARVSVQATGWLHENSRAGRVIRGWDEGVIPRNATLLFEVALRGI